MKSKFIIAIDLGGTNLKLALLNNKYQIKERFTLNTKTFEGKKDLVQAIVSTINQIVEKNCLKKTDILGVGLGLPGPIDVDHGMVHFFPNIAGWREVPLKRILEKKIRIKVFIDNDANLMCLGEYKLGAASGLKNVVCLTLGTGVGGGIIIEKKMYRGSSYAAGEIGHMPINESGPRCNCGGIACLETYIGNDRIKKAARAVFKRDISLETLSALARKGNKRALKIWSDAGARLGIALTGVINLLNPDAIVVGGGISNAGNVLFKNVRATVLKRAMSVQAKEVKILRAKLGTDAGLIGAAILVKESLGG